MINQKVYFFFVSFFFIPFLSFAAWTTNQETAVTDAIDNKLVVVSSLPNTAENSEERGSLSYAAQVLGDNYLSENALDDAAAAYVIALKLGNTDVREFLLQHGFMNGKDTQQDIRHVLAEIPDNKT